jgi:hypothetical protein
MARTLRSYLSFDTGDDFDCPKVEGDYAGSPGTGWGIRPVRPGALVIAYGNVA